MRVLVTGGRRYADQVAVFTVLDRLDERVGIDAVIHGAARGADELAGMWARAHNVPEAARAADWDKYGDKAGSIRNHLMLKEEKPGVVVAFPGNRGTAHMKRIARKAGLRVIDLALGLGQVYRDIEIFAAEQA
jgi:hypothetical protein